MNNLKRRAVSLLLVMAAILTSLSIPSMAADDLGASLSNGSSYVTIKIGTFKNILSVSTGVKIGASPWTYTTNDGITGNCYCVNWGLDMVPPTKRLEITGRYDRSPKTMGAFANGYPMYTLEQFKKLHPDIQGIENLTVDEYANATQIAVWSSCGQVAVEGTSFTAGRATLVKPTSDAQQIRVYQSVVEILKLADSWTKAEETGLYFHMEKEQLGADLTVSNEYGLEGAAENHQDGIKKETINGTEYYTRLMYVDSATSCVYHNNVIKVYSMDAPSGTIFTNANNVVLNSLEQWGATMYEVPVPRAEASSLNSNGVAYSGAFKVCIPRDSVSAAGSMTITAHASVDQHKLYLAYNPTATEQSYILADPPTSACSPTRT